MSTLTKTIGLAIPAAAFLVWSGAVWQRARTSATLLRVIAAVCLLVVVLTHVAESRQWLPVMRWGQPDSAGHYLDFASAVLGVSLFVVSVLIDLRHRHHHASRLS
jgi:hypothetical protein